MSVLYVYCPLTLLKSFQDLMENNLTEKNGLCKPDISKVEQCFNQGIRPISRMPYQIIRWKVKTLASSNRSFRL